MACGATLKRTHEWDPLYSPARSPKRLCLPGELVSPRRNVVTQAGSSILRCSSEYTATQVASTHSHYSTPASCLSTHTLSLWDTPPTSILSRPPRCVDISTNSAQPTDMCLVAASIDGAQQARDTPMMMTRRAGGVDPGPLLTQQQVNALCRVMLDEHEGKCREKFSQILQDKLAEQYESFLTFNHEMVKKRFSASDASYVS